MIKMGTYIYCVDNTGVVIVKVFQVIGNRFTRVATLGTKVLVVVKGVNVRAKSLQDEKKKHKFRRGSVHRAVIVQMKKKFRRRDLSYI